MEMRETVLQNGICTYVETSGSKSKLSYYLKTSKISSKKIEFDAPENGAIIFCCYCFHLAELLLRNCFDSVSIWSSIFGATFDSMSLQYRSTATLNGI